MRSAVTEYLIPGAIVHKRNSYSSLTYAAISIIRARIIRSADYPCTILSS